MKWNEFITKVHRETLEKKLTEAESLKSEISNSRDTIMDKLNEMQIEITKLGYVGEEEISVIEKQIDGYNQEYNEAVLKI